MDWRQELKKHSPHECGRRGVEKAELIAESRVS